MEVLTEKVIGSSQQEGNREHRQSQTRLDIPTWPRQVLLVDDKPLVRQTIGETLRSIGIIVIEASPTEALRLSADCSTCIDLLISDIEMPEMSGWTLASRIASRMDDLPILYISGGIDVDEWQLYPDRVANSYFLAKPFTFGCLTVTLDLMAKSRNLKADYKRARVSHWLNSVLLMAFLMASISAFAAGPCPGRVTTLTAAQRKMYARSISSNFSKGQSASKVEIEKTLTMHNWTAVWARPKDLEEGVFIYSQEKTGLTFHDVWGGYAIPSEKPEVVRWIKKLSSSIPDDFANCVAATITGDE